MATWEDGPEYAPVERPAEFTTPAAHPLEVVPPEPQQAALAPKARPAFDGPSAAVAPLQDLVPAVAGLRDPARPFDVVASTVTSMDSAWGSAHSNGPGLASGAAGDGGPAPSVALPAQPYPVPPPYPAPQAYPQAYPSPQAYPPPTGTPWPGPSSPPPLAGYPPPAPGAYPSPGTPQWFGPGPAGGQAPRPDGRVDVRAVIAAATPGLLVPLLVGGVLSVFAPIMLVLAFVLSGRVRVAAPVRRVLLVSLWIAGFFALGGFAVGRFWFVDWWDYLGDACRVVCWIVLITVLGLVYRALRAASAPPSPPPSSWR